MDGEQSRRPLWEVQELPASPFSLLFTLQSLSVSFLHLFSCHTPTYLPSGCPYAQKLLLTVNLFRLSSLGFDRVQISLRLVNVEAASTYLVPIFSSNTSTDYISSGLKTGLFLITHLTENSVCSGEEKASQAHQEVRRMGNGLGNGWQPTRVCCPSDPVNAAFPGETPTDQMKTRRVEELWVNGGKLDSNPVDVAVLAANSPVYSEGNSINHIISTTN